MILMIFKERWGQKKIQELIYCFFKREMQTIISFIKQKKFKIYQLSIISKLISLSLFSFIEDNRIIQTNILCQKKQQYQKLCLIFNKQPINININIKYEDQMMYTPTNSQKSSRREECSLLEMLKQFDNKINQISQLKTLISQKMINQQIESSTKKQIIVTDKQRQLAVYMQFRNFCHYFKNDVSVIIPDIMSDYHNQNMEAVNSLITTYECQIKKYKNYYETEIWDLRQQIKRQYKVIALMKQQVQDLMVLMRYKENDGQNQDCNQQWPDQSNNIMDQQANYTRTNGSDKNNMRLSGLANREYGQFSGVLQIIQEETERTMQSSQRSQGTTQEQSQCRNFIKIEQKQQDDCQQGKKQQMIEKNDEREEFNMKTGENKQREEYNQNLTPPQQNQVSVSKDKMELSSFYYIERQSQKQKQAPLHPTPIKKDSISSLQVKVEQNINKEAQIKNQIKGNSLKRNKIHTAPSDDRKIDHLQSIFFLDDESEDYYNKTSTLKTYQQKNNNFDGRYSQYSAGEQENSLQDYSRNRHKKNQQIFYRNNSSIIGAQLYQQFRQQKALRDNTDFQYSVSSSSIKSRQESKKNRSECISHEKKSQTMRQLTQQETNQYIYKKFNKVIPISEIQSSSSMPVPLTQNPLEQLHGNAAYERDYKREQNNEHKPKTKQFLQQFRKTFNKCLKSMQVSKKNSGKIATNTSTGIKQAKYTEIQGNNLVAGVMTFGKGYPSNSSSMKQLQIKDKQNFYKQKQRQKLLEQQNNYTKQHQNMKAVDHMLKQLENNTKFIIGNKKLQLKYEGEKKNGVRFGNGILYYSNGLCYQGQFKDGVRYGYGILKFNHIEIYNGDWVNDQIEGEGKIRNCAIINKRKTIYSNQSLLGKWISYSGQFKNSKFQGSGSLYLQGGQKFVGNFMNGYACGQGSIYKKNGEVEYGMWKNNILVTINKDKQRSY